MTEFHNHPEESAPSRERPQLEDDTLLRREAGEGWHEKGLNSYVFGWIIARETLIDAMVQAGVHPPQQFDSDADPRHVELYSVYQEFAHKVEEVKQEANINQPPPLSTEGQ